MKKLIFRCLIFCVLIAFLSGCNETSQIKQITIAVMGSKEVYDYDNSFLNGIQMAIDECNEQYVNSGFTFSYEFFDDNYEFEQGLIIANSIAANSKYTAVIGSHSFNILEATAPIFEQNNKILIAANSMMDKNIVDEGYKLIFRNTLGENDMGKSLAAYANSIGLKKVAVCHSNTEFEMNLVKVFIQNALEYDISVLDSTSIIGSEREFEKTNIMWNALGIDGVLISHEEIDNAFILAKYIRNFNSDMNILGDFSFDASDYLAEYKDFTQGIVTPALVPITLSDKYESFNEKYSLRYNDNPTWWASHGYDSIRIIADSAVSVDSTDPSVIAEKMHSDEGYDGVTGVILFNENGTLIIQEDLYSEVSGSELIFKTID